MEDPFSINKRQAKRSVASSSCYLPYDPAARNIPLSGKTKLTQGLIWMSVSLTLGSIVINSGIAPLSENPMLGPSIKSVIQMGGMTQQLVRGGEWWRIIWAAFLHAGLIHLMLNMLVWICISTIIEPDWGTMRTLFVFCVAAFTGNLLSVTLDPLNVSVGTSGGIYGLMVATSIYVLEYWSTIPNSRAVFVATIVASIVAIATSFIPYVDAYAHIGGAVGGLLASLITFHNFDGQRTRQYTAVVPPPPIKSPRRVKLNEGLDLAKLVERHEKQRSLGLDQTPTKLTVLDTAADEDGMRLVNIQCEHCMDSMQDYPTETPHTLDYLDRISGGADRDLLLLDMNDDHGHLPPSPTRLTASPLHAGDIRLRRSTSMSPPPRMFNTQVSLFDTQVAQPRRKWFRVKPQATHFMCQIGQLNFGNPGKTCFVTNQIGINKVVVNPAASRASIRRTKLLKVANHFEIRSTKIWVTRIVSLFILATIWTVLCYLLFACPECYRPPGQVIQLKRVREGRGRFLAATEPRILL